MKKFIYLLLIVSLLFVFLFGCSVDAAVGSDTAETADKENISMEKSIENVKLITYLAKYYGYDMAYKRVIIRTRKLPFGQPMHHYVPDTCKIYDMEGRRLSVARMLFLLKQYEGRAVLKIKYLDIKNVHFTKRYPANEINIVKLK